MDENLTTDDEFDAAWAEATSDDPVETPEPEEELEEEAPEGDEPEEEAPEPDDEPSAEEPDYKALFAKLQNDYRSMEGRYRAERDRWQQKPSATEPVPTAPAQDDEEQFLNKFRSEYNDEVLKAIDIVSRRRAREIVTQEVSRFAPVENNVQTVLEQLHFQTIETVHPDLQEINDSPEFDAWIESRPVHLRNAYVRVREQGSPQEVISLLDEYKSFHQPKTPPSVPASKVASATAVKTRRGALPSKAGPDLDDFDAAWEEAVSSSKR